MARRLILALAIGTLGVAAVTTPAGCGSKAGPPSPPPTTSASERAYGGTASPPAAAQADEQVKEGIRAIQLGIQAYAADNNDTFPAPPQVLQNGAVGAYVDKWPKNPFSATGASMTQSSQKGNFTYIMTSTSYILAGHLSTSSDFTVP